MQKPVHSSGSDEEPIESEGCRSVPATMCNTPPGLMDVPGKRRPVLSPSDVLPVHMAPDSAKHTKAARKRHLNCLRELFFRACWAVRGYSERRGVRWKQGCWPYGLYSLAAFAVCLVGVAVYIGLFIGASLVFTGLYDYGPHELSREDVLRDLSTVNVSSFPVPPIMHHLALGMTELPPHWEKSKEKCWELNSEYRRILWTESEVRDLIEKVYPDFMPVYESYPYDIQRVDSARYLILHSMGGIYLDLDLECKMSLDVLRQYAFVLGRTKGAGGLSNALMVSTPNHPILSYAIERLPSWNRFYGTKYPTVIFSAGPMFLNIHVVNFLTKLETAILSLRLPDLRQVSDGVKFLPRSVFYDMQNPMFRVVAGSSWHGWDAAFIIWLGRHIHLY